jgi:hypothetical protein
MPTLDQIFWHTLTLNIVVSKENKELKDENAELKAQSALFEASVIGKYIATLGANLITREERFDRVVIDKMRETK